ncbi:alpha/beta fold hydrolase [Oscillatoria sp. CS-180]|uniref:alpha/beta hydrolase n=1 Tax=Oscillatoria sp. CS-180 TaxID=3021720 RepID=UPI00232CB26F|nr:alpha/beta hydrolase [Oscillatoria sp. CS-180]MDB9528516.1 alpha/beta fold hydrolase [Oscillatoria sp. CS-180]
MINLRVVSQMLRRWRFGQVGTAIALALLGLSATAPSSRSAEQIIITYGFFERTVDIADLEAFAQGEELSEQLSKYANSFGLSDTDLESIREILVQKADFDEVDVARFLYTTQGTRLLRSIKDIVQTPSRQPGIVAIRSGLILAAADDEGLTLLNFLKQYPTPAIRIDVGAGLDIAATVAETLRASERAIAFIETLSAEAAQQPQGRLQAVRQLVYEIPAYEASRITLRLPFRDVDAALYLPEPKSRALQLPNEIPVIVISHGLGDEGRSYLYLAEFLAERGFAVATLDHPGSDGEQVSRLFAGLSDNIVDEREFLNRPEDVSALLDEIEDYILNDRELRWRVDTRNVGLIGQSFGGYTALALAGATYNTETLQAACGPREIYFNLSLLLQCEADFEAADPSALKDDRVQAILTVNPIGSQIFGPSGFGDVDVPVMIVAATADTVAPALPEQIEPFTWLQTEYRYLAVAQGTTHFSVIKLGNGTMPSIPVPVSMWGDSPEIAQDYLEILSLMFFQRHLRQDTRYDSGLTAWFIEEQVERAPLEPLSLIQTLNPEALEQAIAGEGVTEQESQQ